MGASISSRVQSSSSPSLATSSSSSSSSLTMISNSSKGLVHDYNFNKKSKVCCSDEGTDTESCSAGSSKVVFREDDHDHDDYEHEKADRLGNLITSCSAVSSALSSTCSSLNNERHNSSKFENSRPSPIKVFDDEIAAFFSLDNSALCENHSNSISEPKVKLLKESQVKDEGEACMHKELLLEQQSSCRDDENDSLSNNEKLTSSLRFSTLSQRSLLTGGAFPKSSCKRIKNASFRLVTFSNENVTINIPSSRRLTEDGDACVDEASTTANNIAAANKLEIDFALGNFSHPLVSSQNSSISSIQGTVIKNKNNNNNNEKLTKRSPKQSPKNKQISKISRVSPNNSSTGSSSSFFGNRKINISPRLARKKEANKVAWLSSMRKRNPLRTESEEKLELGIEISEFSGQILASPGTSSLQEHFNQLSDARSGMRRNSTKRNINQQGDDDDDDDDKKDVFSITSSPLVQKCISHVTNFKKYIILGNLSPLRPQDNHGIKNKVATPAQTRRVLVHSPKSILRNNPPLQ